jgi:hypothetical protein
MDLKSRDKWDEFSRVKGRAPEPIKLPPRPDCEPSDRPPRDRHAIVRDRF